MEFREVYESYKPDLERVEDVLQAAVQSRNAKLSQSALQLLHAGGKRIRPLFALLCGQLGSGNRESVYTVAAALELIHMATLVHDDVIDDASLRRGHPTIRVQYGNRPAMYTGDFLFARAIQLLCTIPDPFVHREMSDAMVHMCEGEIDQVRDFYNWRQNLRTYLRRVERKTALLISVSCALGARVAGAPERVVNQVRRFGYYTGMAFQIIDDVLDYTGDEREVGKPVGGDLRQGNLTLPALWAVVRSPQAQELQQLIRADMNQADLGRALDIIRASDGLGQARRLARRYMEKAARCLESLTPARVRGELAAVAQFVHERTH
ncbi:MAG: polyprenyl synthetase family protein [Alicyclobacillaceae bacterium]|nr:polyprenyl synthetase family protein [Alicyclobacillaceae bacterium]